MDYLDKIKNELEVCKNVLEKFLDDEKNLEIINNTSDLIVNALKNGNKIISCGNGGSMCDAMHFAEELTGKYRDDRKALPAIAISDPSYLTCVGNDYGYNSVFSRFIEGFGQKDDILFAITTSGSSDNVLKALEKAKIKGMKVIVLTGEKGVIHSEYNEYSDIEIKIPYSKSSDRIQEMHIKIIHILIHLIEIKINN